MKIIYHDRVIGADDFTISVITGDDGLQPCFALEDEFREVKVKGDTRIPAGVYYIKFNQNLTPLTKKYRAKFSWFTWHLEITGIKNYAGVYYHIGNYTKDTDGCPLLGLSASLVDGKGVVQNSTQAYEAFYKKVSAWLNAGEHVLTQITDPR